ERGGQPQVDLELTVAGLAVPVGPTPGHVRLGGVDGFAHHGPPVRSWFPGRTLRRCGRRPDEFAETVAMRTKVRTQRRRATTRRWISAGVRSRLPAASIA